MGMKTFEMMEEAKVTGKTYVAKDMRYSKVKGFHHSNGSKWEANAFTFLNDLFSVDWWEELKPTKMTLKEIETKLGYPIEIVNE